MKSFKDIYGDYATVGFITRIKEVANEAKGLAILSRNEECYKDLHSKECGASAEAVEFWSKLDKKAEEWLNV